MDNIDEYKIFCRVVQKFRYCCENEYDVRELYEEYLATQKTDGVVFPRRLKLPDKEVVFPIVDLLQKALGDEFISAKQYEIDSSAFGKRRVRREFKKHSKEELGHAKTLIDILFWLGGEVGIAIPVLPGESSAGVDSDILMITLMKELLAIEDYRFILKQLRETGNSVYRRIKKILRDEEEHAKDTFKFLKNYEEYEVSLEFTERDVEIVKKLSKHLAVEKEIFYRIKNDLEELGLKSIHGEVNFSEVFAKHFNTQVDLVDESTKNAADIVNRMIKYVRENIQMYKRILQMIEQVYLARDSLIYRYVLAIIYFREDLLKFALGIDVEKLLERERRLLH